MRRFAGVLLLGLALAVAGCVGPGALNLERIDDSALAARGHHSLAEFERHPDTARFGHLVRETIANGTAVTEDRRAPPEGTGYPLRTEQGFYAIERERIWNGSAVLVDVGIDDGTDVTDGAIPWSSLPEGDREALTRAVDTLRSTDDTSEDGSGASVTVPYTEPERTASVLLDGDRHAVRHEHTVYHVVLDPTYSTTVSEYRYTARRVARNRTAFARWLEREHVFTLRDLSTDEHRLVAEAIDSTYLAGDTDDEAFQSLVYRFRRHEPIERTGDDNAEYIVRYRNRTYWAYMRYEGFI